MDIENRKGEPMKSSTMTGIAAVAFGCGLVALLIALYRGTGIHSPFLWIGLVLLVATVVCWLAAARTQSAQN